MTLHSVIPPLYRPPHHCASGITGSYSPDDCIFLLQPLSLEFTSVEEKEALIQSGRAHYSELVSQEAPPTPEYLSLFEELTNRHALRMARDVVVLAQYLHQRADTEGSPIVLVSLARAGTPVGALVKRALVRYFHTPAVHYSISIVRDRGVDEAALHHILCREGHLPQRLVFLDAWTAKGVIAAELKRSIARWNERHTQQLAPELAVLSDIGGAAEYSATLDDYAIPSGILNATVSGLVSRSVWPKASPANQFHGCVIYDHLAPWDRTQWFLGVITEAMDQIFAQGAPRLAPITQHSSARAETTRLAVSRWQRDYHINDINLIKPGIAEATRVLLRRVPALLLLQDAEEPDVQHLRLLAAQKGVPIDIAPSMPFKAAAFIRALNPTPNSAPAGGQP